MKPKVLLVKPPEQSDFNFGTFSLGVLAAAVRDIAEVSVLDATDLLFDEAIKAVESYACDWIGITVMGLKSVKPAADFIHQVRLMRDSKNIIDKTTIVVGGHGASMTPKLLLEAGADVAVIGEGEQTFRNLLIKGVKPGESGCACQVDNQLVVGPRQILIDPLDRLEPPARDLMPKPRDGIHLMETSRGCPFACTFCETTRFYNRRWRPQSADKVAIEVRRLVNDFDAWIIHIADDNFAASSKRVLEICEALCRGPLPVFFLASARADDLIRDPEVLPAMAAAHILRVSVGVETLDPEIAVRVDKPIPPITYQIVFSRMRELGIFSVASFIIGLPGENEQARHQAVKLAIEAGPDSSHFLPFLPFPGLPINTEVDTFDPRSENLYLAEKFTRDFLLDSKVQDKLKEGVHEGGVRGLLCRATLEKHNNIL